MTTPNPAGGVSRAAAMVRTLAVWSLVGFAGLVIFFAFLTWLVPAGPAGFAFRSREADFVNVYTLAMPVLATLLAAYVTPPLASARLIALVALAEYAAVLVFGALAFLIGLGAAFDNPLNAYAAGIAIHGLRYVVLGLAGLALTAVAGLAAFRIFTELGGTLPGFPRTARPGTPPAA